MLRISRAIALAVISLISISCGGDSSDGNGPGTPEHLVFYGSTLSSDADRMLRMDSDSPFAARSIRYTPVTLGEGQKIKGMVWQPTTGKLFGVSRAVLYEVDTATGARTAVGTPPDYGAYIGAVAYDPNSSLIRIFTYTNVSFSIDPATGDRSDDGPAPVYAEGDLYAGDTLGITAMAYGAKSSGVTGYPLYAIDYKHDMLVRSDEPSTGVFHSVRYLYLNGEALGFSISSKNVGYLVAIPHGGPGITLYQVNLATGETTNLAQTNFVIRGGMAMVETDAN